ncbi:MAG: 4,5-dioxygenase [Bacteriovorax sp. MedPE-SWde]|nr:MAG: 4,5-dioxygenase [Bacteriovorax sp. MedPE-SWde]
MDIKEYHAHFYYSEQTLDKARAVIEKAQVLDGVSIGRIHERPVGPHPMWSCQLLIPASKYKITLDWLMLNRDGLTVFIHPLTGNDILDHTDYAMWMGDIVELELGNL